MISLKGQHNFKGPNNHIYGLADLEAKQASKINTSVGKVVETKAPEPEEEALDAK